MVDRESAMSGRDVYVVGRRSTRICNLIMRGIREPDAGANPVVLHGPLGVGKTSLLRHLENIVREEDDSSRVVYLTAENFVGHLIEAIRRGTSRDLVSALKGSDVLLLDGAEHLAKRSKAGEEVATIIRHLCETGTRVVLAADDVDEDPETMRWFRRFRRLAPGSTMITVRPPGRRQKLAILKKRIEALGIAVPQDVVQFLAESTATDNLCRMVGVLNRMDASARFQGRQMSLAVARRILERPPRTDRRGN